MRLVFTNLPSNLLRNRLSSQGLFYSSTLVLLLQIILIITTVPQSHASSDVEEIELNVERISELGNTDVLLSTISRLALALNKCGVDVRGLKELQRVMLPSDTNAKCMDGTTAGYYIRRKAGSKRWLIFLEGGHYCFDKRSCRTREDNEPNMTSSTHWPLTKEGSGILSWNPEENPFLFSANVVYVPYCSSDAWSGNNTKNGLHFHGVTIINEVVKDLYKYGLKEGGKLFLAGSSAGATGVLLNIDRVSATLAEDAPGLDVHGIVDSGWFLDTEQLHKTECTNTINCPPAESVKKGFRLWKPEIPKRCRRAYPDEPWRCFFGYRIYPYIKSPLFVISYLYDRAQVLTSMGGGFSAYQQVQHDSLSKRNTEGITYMRELARLMNHTLTNVSAVFAPTCMDHEILLRSMWHSMAIDGVTLIEALRCWEGSKVTTNRPRQMAVDPSPWEGDSYEVTDLTDLLDLDDDDDLDVDDLDGNSIRHGGKTKEDRDERRRKRKQRKKKLKKRRQRKQRLLIRRDLNAVDPSSDDDDIDEDESDPLLEMALQSNSLKAYTNERQAQCRMKLYDSCTRPNCNLRCPTYLDMFGTSSNRNTNNNRPNSRSNNVGEGNFFNTDVDDLDNSISDPATREEIIDRQR